MMSKNQFVFAGTLKELPPLIVCVKLDPYPDLPGSTVTTFEVVFQCLPMMPRPLTIVIACVGSVFETVTACFMALA
jgi:hypothetical protein